MKAASSASIFAGATVAVSALLWTACGGRLAPGTTTIVPGGTTIGAGQTPIDRDDIGGVVTGASGGEPGVWVVAETSDLPTKFAKIVVTDDRGRYLLPDLPEAT